MREASVRGERESSGNLPTQLVDSVSDREVITPINDSTLTLALPTFAAVAVVASVLELFLGAGHSNAVLAATSGYVAILLGFRVSLSIYNPTPERTNAACAPVCILSLAWTASLFLFSAGSILLAASWGVTVSSCLLLASPRGALILAAVAAAAYSTSSFLGLPEHSGATAATGLAALTGVWAYQAERRRGYVSWTGRVRAQISAAHDAPMKDRRAGMEAPSHSDSSSKSFDADAEMDGQWEWNLVTDQVYLSPRWRFLLGYESKSTIIPSEDWLNMIHPYDLKEVTVRLRRHLSGETPDFECEHRIRRANGGYRWVLSQGRAVRGESGAPERVSGHQIDITRQKDYESDLYHQANHDKLTGLANRESLLEHLETEIQTSHRDPDYRFAVAFVYLDGFKQVNDSLGHAVGDELLQVVTKRLQDALRKSDFVARIGGDEFVLVLQPVLDEVDAREIVEAVLKALGEPCVIRSNEVAVGASVGVTLCSEDNSRDADNILRDADIAMYQAKCGGKGRLETYQPTMRQDSSREFVLRTGLSRAVERQELDLHYQPMFCARQGRIVAAEALMRWTPKGGAPVPPCEFIPLAEEMNLINDLGAWALEKVARQHMAWREEGLGSMDIAVNLSPRQLRNPDFSGMLQEILRKTGQVHDWLQLEITESALLEDDEVVRANLDRLSAMGIQIAIDDFGTGYSSLAHLRSVKFDILKIDQLFVQNAYSDQKTGAITRSIISLAHSLRLRVVGEGVETLPQFDFLLRHDCDFVQGYLTGKPQTQASFTEVLKRVRLSAQNPDRSRSSNAPSDVLETRLSPDETEQVCAQAQFD